MLYRPPPRGIRGKTTPRLFTPPLRPLTRRTSDGYDVADFAEMIGQPLLPWERWAAIHALELNPDGSYRFGIVLIIVARQSGKSHLKRIITLWRMYTTPRARILGIAQDCALARDQWSMCQETIHESPRLQEEWGGVRNVNGDEYFWLKNKARYLIKAANRRAGRGGSNDEVNVDELREQQDWKAWAAVSKTTLARADSQIFCMSNAGDDTSVVLNQLRESALAGTDPRAGVFEWSGEYDDEGRYCELDDWRQIAQANPGLGYTVSAAAIASAMVSDPPEIFRTEVLCQRVKSLASAIDLTIWEDLADAGDLSSHRKRLAAVIDVAPDGAHVTLAVAAMLDGGRVRGEIAAAWDSTDAARTELAAYLARIRPVAIGWFPAGPAAAIATVLRPSGPAIKIEKAAPGRPAWVELTGGEVGQACQGLADLVRGRRILHPADPLLDAHIAAARKLATGDGWRFTRHGEGHVDAAYAFAGAVHLAQLVPAPKRARIRSISA
jgi:hypothetical protein